MRRSRQHDHDSPCSQGRGHEHEHEQESDQGQLQYDHGHINGCGHGHAHGHLHGAAALLGSSRAVRTLRTAFFLNAGFAIIELIGGIFTGSFAILADALHDLGDSLSLGLALYLQKKSETKPSAHFTYGYQRLSLLSALITAIFLTIGSTVIVIQAGTKLIDPGTPSTNGMLGLAILGVLVNGYAAWKTGSGRTQSERAITLHLLEDVLGWVAILVGSLVIKYTGWTRIDPILAIAMSCFILWNVVRNLRETMGIFLQGAPPDLNLTTLKQQILEVSGVIDVHDIHSWSLDGENHVLSLHLVTDTTAAAENIDIKQKVRTIIAKLGRFHVTIETEAKSETCSLNCDAVSRSP